MAHEVSANVIINKGFQENSVRGLDSSWHIHFGYFLILDLGCDG